MEPRPGHCEVCDFPVYHPLAFWEAPDGVTRAVCLNCQVRYTTLPAPAQEEWLKRRGWAPKAKMWG